MRKPVERPVPTAGATGLGKQAGRPAHEPGPGNVDVDVECRRRRPPHPWNRGSCGPDLRQLDRGLLWEHARAAGDNGARTACAPVGPPEAEMRRCGVYVARPVYIGPRLRMIAILS